MNLVKQLQKFILTVSKIKANIPFIFKNIICYFRFCIANIKVNARNYNIQDKFLEERTQWILWIPIFFSLGIMAYLIVQNEPSFAWIILIIIILLVLLCFKRNLFILSLLIMASGFMVINLRAILLYSPKLIEEMKYIRVTGQIESIIPLPVGDRIIIKNVNIAEKTQNLSLSKIRLTIKTGLNDAEIGDIITMKANIIPPSPIVIEGGYDFVRSSYFEQIKAVGYNITPLKILKKNQGNVFTNYVANLRKSINQEVIKTLGKDVGGVATALMTGEYNVINKTILTNMRIAGVSHILSVSGMHLSLAAAIFFYLVRLFFSLFYPLFYRVNIKKTAANIALLGSFGYLLISGMQVAAIRAFIMTTMIIIAVILDRTATPMRGLALAALIILLIRPEAVINPSFQMSFMAVLALIVCYDLYKKYLSPKVKSWNMITKILFYFLSTAFSSLIAGLATAPFVIYHFNQYSNYGVIANLIAVPITSFIVMPCVILAFILYPFHLMNLALIPMGYGIKIFITISNIIANWPHSVKFIHFMSSTALFIMSFGMLIIFLGKTNLRFSGVLLIVIASLLIYFQPLPDLIVDSKNQFFLFRDDKQNLIFSSKKIPRYTKEAWLHYMGQEKFLVIDDCGDNLKLRCSKYFDCIFNKENYQILLTPTQIILKEIINDKEIFKINLLQNLDHIYLIYMTRAKIVTLSKNRGNRLWNHNRILRKVLKSDVNLTYDNGSVLIKYSYK